VLRKHRLVSERRSSADARDVYYRFDHERFRSGFLASGSRLDPGLQGEGEEAEGEAAEGERPTGGERPSGDENSGETGEG